MDKINKWWFFEVVLFVLAFISVVLVFFSFCFSDGAFLDIVRLRSIYSQDMFLKVSCFFFFCYILFLTLHVVVAHYRYRHFGCRYRKCLYRKNSFKQ